MSSSYTVSNGHHQIWIRDGHGLPVSFEIDSWLREFADGKILGICSFTNTAGDSKGTFYNFSCKETAMRFKLIWG